MTLLGEIPPHGITYLKPGPCHKARFMAFCIFCMKMLLFIRQMEVDAETLEGLLRLCIFYTCVYIPHFLRSSVGVDAAYNDLALFKTLYSYMDMDGPLATESLEVLSRHGWYTTQQTVIFSLFTNRVTEDEKARIAARILTFEQPDQFKLGKPVFQELTVNTELQDLCGPYSYMLFTILGLNSDWLRKDPKEWSQSDDYKEMEEYVRSLKVVNDTAERGVKMITDYSKILTKDEKLRGKLLQGVEMSRKINPNFKKSTLNTNTRW